MDIIYPVFSLVILTFIMLAATGITRLISVRRRQVHPRYYVLMSGDTPPDYVQKVGRNMANLLEVPVLFYLLAVLVVVFEINNQLLVDLAWLYVAFGSQHYSYQLQQCATSFYCVRSIGGNADDHVVPIYDAGRVVYVY